jgi:hypothetical protein
MENLFLFFAAILKCGLYTGLLPGVFGIVVYAGGKLARARRVPPLDRPAKVVSFEKPRPCRMTVRAS